MDSFDVASTIRSRRFGKSLVRSKLRLALLPAPARMLSEELRCIDWTLSLALPLVSTLTRRGRSESRKKRTVS